MKLKFIKKSELSRRDMFFLLNDVGVGTGTDNRQGGGRFGDGAGGRIREEKGEGGG